MFEEYPKWLYSRDHGSVLVDTPEDALNLPHTDWYATPDFAGHPHHIDRPVREVIIAIEEDIDESENLQQVKNSGEEVPALKSNKLIPAAEMARQLVEIAHEVINEHKSQAKVDKRTKAYRDSLK